MLVGKRPNQIFSYRKDIFFYLGNSDFIENQQNVFNSVLNDCTEPEPTSCNKDTGCKQRLQKWSRGHLFIVRGGGIIDKWSLLFRCVHL
jgi:hypothetical protein